MPILTLFPFPCHHFITHQFLPWLHIRLIRPLISYPAFQLGVFLTGSLIHFEASKIFDLLHEGKKKVIWCPDKGDIFLPYIDVFDSNAICPVYPTRMFNPTVTMTLMAI